MASWEALQFLKSAVIGSVRLKLLITLFGGYDINTYLRRIIKLQSMKLQCQVCHESPIVDVVKGPTRINDLVCCPSCDKQLAYATEKKYSSKLIWKPIDTDFNKELGVAPVKLISL